MSENVCSSDQENYIQIDFLHYGKSKNHVEAITKTPRCTGKEREKVSQDLVELGVMNTETNHEIYNYLESKGKKINCRFALSKIKSEYINRNKFLNDLSIDANAAKLLTDKLS